MAEIKSIASGVARDVSASTEGENRIEHVLSNLLKLASGEFQITEMQEIKNDNIDAIDRGVVMLGEHLEDARIKHEKHIKEKEDLVKEIHHRVKNNLQIVSSLLNLQAQFTYNDQAQLALKQSQWRINSMSMIHEMLYRSENISQVNFKEYLLKLMILLVDSIKGNSNNIMVDVRSPVVMIALDSAVTLGVLINEVVTNSLIHGIKNEGQVYARLKKSENGSYCFKMGDNGVGFKELKENNSLGLNLIEILTDQLDGDIERSFKNGTHYSFILAESIFLD